MTPASSLRTQLRMSQPAWEHRARDHSTPEHRTWSRRMRPVPRPKRAPPGPRRPPRSPALAHHLRLTLLPQVGTHCAPHAFKIHLDAARAPSITFHELRSKPVFAGKAAPQPRQSVGDRSQHLPHPRHHQAETAVHQGPSRFPAQGSSADISGLPDLGLLSPFYQGGGNRVRTGTLARPGSSRGSGVIHLTSAGLVGTSGFALFFSKALPVGSHPTGKNIYI